MLFVGGERWGDAVHNICVDVVVVVVVPGRPFFRLLSKVTKDDVIVAEKVEGDIGTTLEISDVLLVGTRDSTTVGRPTVPGATVKLFVEEQTKDKKVGVRQAGPHEFYFFLPFLGSPAKRLLVEATPELVGFMGDYCDGWLLCEARCGSRGPFRSLLEMANIVFCGPLVGPCDSFRGAEEVDHGLRAWSVALLLTSRI